MDLINKNSVIFKDIIGEVMKVEFDGIFLIATNPLDVMTYLTYKYSGLKENKIIGSGTSLDSARLRYILSDRLKINSKNIHAYVIGEHGDSEFVPWSCATIGPQGIDTYLSKDELNNIYVDVRDAAYEIIKKKGATYYGIGMCLTRITNAILNDENSIITVSSYDEENGIFIGWPSIINKDGVNSRTKLNLTSEEELLYKTSVNTIKEAIKNIK